MTPGLYHYAASKAEMAAKKRAIADDPESAPFIAYSAHHDSIEMAREMVEVGLAIEENEAAILFIQDLLNLLGMSAHKSRHRSLTITWMEAAQDRLRRELGDKPADASSAKGMESPSP